MSNTNFFQAFTASANVPAIYLQQFWKTMSYNKKTGVYSCQLDEQWFDLSADLLRKALAITPVNPTHLFELPPSGDTVLDFVNELGYPEPVEIVSSIRTNYLGTKLDDALLKVLERHTADLIEKYSVLPGPESIKNQESEKSPKEIIKAKKEQEEEKQDSTYSIRSTDKVDIEEFDLKSAL
ncbi:hypothetical protein Tco_0202424, partial [Tanacetum coccineum]